MTLTMADIKAMKDDWLTPATVGSAMHMDPGRLIWYAKNGQLPFATRISGNRVLISRQSFLKCYGHMEEEKEQDNRLERIEALLVEILDELKGRRRFT